MPTDHYPSVPQAPLAAPKEEKPLPVDLLLAKAKAFRESQEQKKSPATPPPAAPASAPEQLRMNLESTDSEVERARRMAREVTSATFDLRDLEIPAFIRRRQADKGHEPQTP